MIKRINEHGYEIAECLHSLINNEVLPGLAVKQADFWQTVADVLNEFIPRNKTLLNTRDHLQTKIDEWHGDESNKPFSQDKYLQFLTDIGYLLPEQSDFHITTENVDAEVALLAGPQLVVPLMNARFALNAANARWGSLYDALYGSDVIKDEPNSKSTSVAYDPLRGKKVQSYARDFLDLALPLAQGSHHAAVNYKIENQTLIIELNTGTLVTLKNLQQFVGFRGGIEAPSAILCVNNGLHIEIQIDKNHAIGQTDAAGIKDLVLESALSTIQDCEDSIAAVDAMDKTAVYANWLGLMKGTLAETIHKNGKTSTRTLNPDRTYSKATGETISLPGRSLLFIRNVGHLMTTDAILTAANEEVPEGIVDALVTSLIGLHDLQGTSKYVNSKQGSIYIVKPKMHGPEEVQFTNDLFSRIESNYGLKQNTIKMGIMDEERRTSANLKECIRAASARVAFINTGFLDRTGDEIHTSMLAGPMVRKELMKNEQWISAYENRNVMIGLKAGLKGKAQIGKGMWATPDEMAAMLKAKIGHPKSGASCAWVPSPTAATLHVMHYHQVNVSKVQDLMLAEARSNDDDSQLHALLTIPLLKNSVDLPEQERQEELDNNVQGLLGYVVRWVNQGVGCSKVPDINNVGRMEDRATLRISSQHICNWLHHGLLSVDQVMQTLKRMAVVVDAQNAQDSSYIAMAPNFDGSLAFQAAVDLIFQGELQPSGYTEPLLHKKRNELKKSLAM
ncbi:malate synthase G [Paraglaciecola hydrolytica]|uniref:Malate synthase G n=1 Tax=Paraglaciecola hydrolytica TaxID=1799789 RepID=A0A136A6G8_9ALTE|nr:malate synthase G [Paraglaciecola hydrolytica]KXI30835.1 malate synthase G [Paraglaciecola hydrolytica]